MKIPTFVEIRLWLYKRLLKPHKISKKTCEELKSYMNRCGVTKEQINATKALLKYCDKD